MRGSVQRRGRESWRIRLDLGIDPATGKRRRPAITIRGKRADAEKKLAEMIAAKGNGKFVEPSKIIVADFVRARVLHWFKAGDISLRTRENYDDAVERHIAPFLGAHRLQALRTLDIEQWHVTLRTEGRADGQGGLSPRTIRAAHRILGKALREAVKHGLVSRNVCNGAEGGEKPPKGESSEVEIIAAEEIAGVIDKLCGRAIYPKAMISLFTGLRRGEVLALQWGDIDFETKTMHVRRAIEETKAEGLRIKVPKTKAAIRDLVMPEIVIAALIELRREAMELRIAMGLGRLTNETLLFPHLFSRGLQSPNQYSGDWREAVISLRLPDVTLHALRHTHASMLIDSGVDIVRISKRLGHADPAITLKIYAHLFRQRDDKSANAIDTALATLREKRS